MISTSKSATGQRVYHKCSDCKARGGNLGLGPRLNLEVDLEVNMEVNLEVNLDVNQVGCQLGSRLGLSSVQVESEVLLVQALFAEVEELEFPREVLPHYVFGCLQTKIRYDLDDQD